MKQLIYIFIFLAAISCKKDIYSGIIFNAPVFPDSVEVKTTLLNDTIYTKLVSGIGIYKDYLVLSTPGEDYMFQLYDAETGTKIKEFGKLGRGPQEIFNVSGVSINPRHGTLTAFHQESREIYCFYLDSVIQDRPHFMDKINIKRYEDMTFFSALRCDQGFLLHGGKCVAYPGGTRLTLFTEDGQIMDAYDKYPVSSNPKDSIEAGDDWRWLYPCAALSPDGTKYAEATEVGGILQTFQIDDKIHPMLLRGYYKPHFYVEKNQPKYTKKTQFAFAALKATDNYLYALSFNGGNASYYPPKEVQVFDWQGNPIKRYKTNQYLMRFCVDEAKAKVYAIAFVNYEYHLVSFNL